MATPADRLRAAVAEIAAEEIEGLIAEARQAARVRVRDRITDALAEAMVEQAADRFAPRPGVSARPAASPRPEPEEPGPDGSALYAYCIVTADTELPAGLPSIGAASSTLIRHAGLAAVVSEVPLADFSEDRLRENLADMEWLERTARTHELALETIGRHTTLIPMRLCSLYRGRAGVVAMLSREAAALRTALEHLEGKSEWGVKAFATPPPRESPTVPGDSGTDYMRRRRADRDRRQDADQQQYETCLAIHERLAEVVGDALSAPAQRPEVSGHSGQMLLNGVYLVEDDQRESFQELVAQLQVEHLESGIELEVTGPWPAYNFVPGTIGAAW